MTAILRVLCNVRVYCAMSKIKIDPYNLSFDSIVQCPNVLRNVNVYCAMSKIKVNPCGVNCARIESYFALHHSFPT